MLFNIQPKKSFFFIKPILKKRLYKSHFPPKKKRKLKVKTFESLYHNKYSAIYKS